MFISRPWSRTEGRCVEARGGADGPGGHESYQCRRGRLSVQRPSRAGSVTRWGSRRRGQPSDFPSDALVSDEPKEHFMVTTDLARDLAREAQAWLRREGLTAIRP